MREKRALIAKSPKGYHVLSERGKNLGGPYRTEQEARDRLSQVEYFKAKHKKASWVDKLVGGKADKKKPSDFPPKKILQGMKHEREHAKDKHYAAEIAMDHLIEDPNYYDKLKKIEKSAAGINRAMGNGRTAVIIEGNRNRGYNSDGVLDEFYESVEGHLESLGFSVTRDPGLPYTIPPVADVWIGHSRGGDRLRFAPEGTFTIALGSKRADADVIINHPLDTDLSVEDGVSNPFHVVYSLDMKQRVEQALDKHFSAKVKSAAWNKAVNPNGNIVQRGIKKTFNGLGWAANKGFSGAGKFIAHHPMLAGAGAVLGTGALMHGLTRNANQGSQGFSGSKYASDVSPAELVLGTALAVPVAIATGTAFRAPSMTAKALAREHIAKLQKYNQQLGKDNEYSGQNKPNTRRV